jgi:hypothetical protein
MLRVRDWGGAESNLDEDRATRWIVKTTGLPRPLAREVGGRLPEPIGRCALDDRQLLIQASRP